MLSMVIHVATTMLLVIIKPTDVFSNALQNIFLSSLTVSDHLLQRDCLSDFNHFDILTSDTTKLECLLENACLLNVKENF